MKIISHYCIGVNNKLVHASIVENFSPPKAYDVAVKVNYHPQGYNLESDDVSKIGFNSYLVTWVSWNNCD